MKTSEYQKGMIEDYSRWLCKSLKEYSVEVKLNIRNWEDENSRDAFIKLKSPNVRPTKKGRGYFALLFMLPRKSGFKSTGIFYFAADSGEGGMLCQKYLDDRDTGKIAFKGPEHLVVRYASDKLHCLPFEDDVKEILDPRPITTEDEDFLRGMDIEEFNEWVNAWHQSL
jgi:hypothetical protein